MLVLTPQRLNAILVALVVLTVVALKGGRTERWGFLALLADYVGSPILQARASWMDPQYAMFALDCGFLLALASLAVFSGRMWPILAAGFHAITVSTYCIFWMSPEAVYRAFYLVNSALAYLIEGALVGGCLVEGPPLPRWLPGVRPRP